MYRQRWVILVVLLALSLSFCFSGLLPVNALQQTSTLTVNPAMFNPTVTSTSLSFTLTDTINKPANIKIYSGSGTTLYRAINCGTLSSGSYSFGWDGKDQSSAYVADGSYKAVLSVETDNWNSKFTPLNSLEGAWSIKNAAFSSPYGLASDSSGYFYVVDDMGRVSKYDSSGNCVLSWGSKGSGDGQLNGAACLAVGSDGSVFVADTLNNRVQKFSSAGVFVSKWGSYGTSNGNFNNPRAIAVDSSNNVYVSDSTGRVQKFDSSGVWLTSFAGISYLSYAMAVDSSGYLYVADPNNGVIKKVRPSGDLHSTWSVSWPVGVDIGPDGNVYVMQYNSRSVGVFTSSGSLVRTFTYGTGTGDGQFYDPTSLTVDSSGYVYTSDRTPNNVQKFTSTGTFTYKLLSTGPVAAELGPNGYIYVVDKFNNKVQYYTVDGTFVGAWGSKGSGNGQFSSPSGVTVDSVGNVFVADTGNNRVQKFTSTGTYITKWSVSTPYGLDVDSLDNVYVATYTSCSVTKYSSDGVGLRSYGSFSNPYFPIDVALDSLDNVYIAIHGSNYIYHYIYVYSQAGAQLRTFGGGGEYAWQYPGTFKSISSIAVDDEGYVYVADDAISRITRFFSNGTYINVFGSLVGSGGALSVPMGLCTDDSGNVYIADGVAKNIVVYDSSSVNAQTYSYNLKWGSFGTGNGQFSSPSGITFCGDGYVYTVDRGSYCVQKFDTSGVFQLKWGSYGSNPEQFRYPMGIASDSSNVLYVLDKPQSSTTFSVKKFTTSGGFVGALTCAISRSDVFAQDIDVDGAGNIYAMFRSTDDYNYWVIQKLASDGSLIYEKVGYGTQGTFYGLKGLAVDSAGDVYVLDNYSIKKLDSFGNVVYSFCDRGLGLGQLFEAQRIEIDLNDNLYVADRQSGRITKFTCCGEYLGSWGSYGTGDGQITTVTGLAVDDNENMYTLEDYNRRVQKWVRDKELQTASANVVVDRYAPSTYANLQGTYGNNGWMRSDTVVTVGSSDSGSGVDKTYYFLNSLPYVEYTVPFTISVEGTTNVYAYSVDKVGNVETGSLKRTVKIDKTLPTITGATTTSPNSEGWFSTNVVVHFTASDLVSGVTSVTSDVTLSSEGTGLSASGTATDTAGNSASVTVSGINIDKTKPSSSAVLSGSLAQGGHYTSDVNVTISGIDTRSGVKELHYVLDGQPEGLLSGSSGSFLVTTGGSHTVQYWSADRAGNVESLKTISFSVIYNTVLTVACDPTTVNKVYGETTVISGVLKTCSGTPVANMPVNVYFQVGSDPDDPYSPYSCPSSENWVLLTSTPVLTSSVGVYQYDWTPSLQIENGTYWLKAEFLGATGYLACSVNTGTAGAPNLFIVPEYLLGGVVSLIVCFAAFGVYRMRSKNRKLFWV